MLYFLISASGIFITTVKVVFKKEWYHNKNKQSDDRFNGKQSAICDGISYFPAQNSYDEAAQVGNNNLDRKIGAFASFPHNFHGQGIDKNRRHGISSPEQSDANIEKHQGVTGKGQPQK